MTMHYALAPHIRVCRTQCDTVGLDLQRNRYFGLGDNETSLLVHLGVLDGGEATLLSGSQVSTLRDALMRAGLLVPADATHEGTGSGPSMTMDPPAASAGYEHTDTAPIRMHHILNLLRAFMWAQLALKKQSLHAISLQVSRARLTRKEPFESSRAIALVSTFRRLRPFLYGARQRCLLHALTLTRFLAHYDQYPHWVIGVRTRPWAAHSWVQAGVMVLDGRPDDVCDYTPLLTA